MDDMIVGWRLCREGFIVDHNHLGGGGFQNDNGNDDDEGG